MIQRFYNYLLKNQILFALFILAICWFLVQNKDILVSLFLAYIIASSIMPFVAYLQKKHLPKIWSVTIPYAIMILTIFLIIIPLITFIISQIQLLVTGLPGYVKQAGHTFGVSIDIEQFQSYITRDLNSYSKDALNVTTKFFGSLFSILVIFIISFYLLLYYDEFKKSFAKLFRTDTQPYVLTTLDLINEKLGSWLRGQIILMIFIGLMSWVALTILKIPNAIPLALLSGVLEIIPTLGPILSAVPAVIVAISVSPTLAITVAVAYILIQVIENNLLVPKVMQKAVGLNPVVVILSVITGANLMGMSGGLLAIPFVSFIIVIFKSLQSKQS